MIALTATRIGLLTFQRKSTTRQPTAMSAVSHLGKLQVGHNPNWIGVTADGRYAVVSTTDDDSASIVDLSTRKVAAIAHVGHQPKRLAVGKCARGAP